MVITVMRFNLLLALSALLLPALAPAAIVIDVTEVGGDLSVVADGSLNITGASFLSSDTGTGRLIADQNVLFSAPSSYATGDPLDVYNTASSPGSFFGSSSTTLNGVNYSGALTDVVGVDANNVYIYGTYVSNAPLSSSLEISGATFASLGITPGSSFVWSLSNGDTVTVNFASAIPEPSAYLAALGFALLGVFVWRRRRRAAL